MVKIKGTIDSAYIPIGIYISLLLIVFASLFLAQTSVESNLYAEIEGSEKNFQAQNVLAAVLSNQTLRNRTGYYPIMSDEKRRRVASNDFQKLEQILSQQSDTYAFTVSGTDVRLGSGRGRLAYASAYVASPSKQPVYVTLGIGGQNG